MYLSLSREIIYVNPNMLYTWIVAAAKSASSLDHLFRALADSTRLRLLNLIADREICVCYFVGILRVSQPKISRHLAYLRRAGIVAARREGRWMHYRLVIPADPVVAAILRATIESLRTRPEMQRDLARLGSACCAPERFEALRGAPPPVVIAAARTVAPAALISLEDAVPDR
ncbi:MAG TPA: metalloregulator ArsR/SmtB family transcription factor [Candidatus Acidoferrum sp.]|nr:metalloregulator ArsR/SmtB family transcription factor [Candidatus Acidoferrum sp.]